MPNKEMVRKALECIAEDRQKSCTGCEYSIFGLYPFCIHGIARDALAMMKEQDEQNRKWLQNIADNQIANAPKDSPMSLDEMLESEYKSGIYEGLQIAFEILTEGR